MVLVTQEDRLTERDIPIEYLFGSLGLYKGARKTGDDIRRKVMRIFERRLLMDVLKRMKNNRGKTAKYLGVDLSIFKYRLKLLRIPKKWASTRQVPK